ncbi:hypothetical protein GX865_02865 [Candidatus Saccharibacteria bacterium]|jgi:hypothetical protein|nr:hypothetical protein [Candidatus Saccharibacteria bacterium]
MKLSYEETPIKILQAHDLPEGNRTEAKRRLDFIAAKLANKALSNIDLNLK